MVLDVQIEPLLLAQPRVAGGYLAGGKQTARRLEAARFGEHLKATANDIAHFALGARWHDTMPKLREHGGFQTTPPVRKGA